MALNPNWPVTETAWGPAWTAGGGRVPPDRYVEVTAIGQFTTGRGRQYQLDQVQAGTSALTLPNQDGSLDPDNAAGPFAGHILPFQPIRRRAQYPPTVNLLTQVQATGGDVGGTLGTLSTSDTGPRILSDTDTSNGSFVASGTAWQGGTVAQFAVLSTATTGQWICYTAQPAVMPGQQYTVQLRVRNVTASTTVGVAAAFLTKTVTDTVATTVVGSTASLVGSATAAWTQITVTATAAATSSGLWVGVQVVTAPGATASVQVDGWQLEKGATATTWVQPGVWYPVTSQFAEKWTADWTDSGTRGIVQPAGVDALALLSQTKLPAPLSAEIARHNPRFLYKLDDPSGSLQATDATGNNGPASVNVSKFGPGSLVFGTNHGSGYTGDAGTVATFDNPNPGVNTIPDPATYIDLSTAGIKGPASADWTRIFAFRYTGPTPSFGSVMWSSIDHHGGSGSRLYWYIDPTGALILGISGPTGVIAHYTAGTAPSVVDANWHFAFASYSHANLTLTVQVDGQSTTYTGLLAADEPTALVSEAVGAWVDPTVGNGTTYNYKGDMSFVAEFPSALSSSDGSVLYNAWKNSFAGESTGARYSRILQYAGYAGASTVDTGLTTSMGPASNIADQDAVSALQGVVDTEGGAHYVTAGGVLTFASRSRRYNALTPMYTFGERGDLGEWPYEDCKPDFDATHLGGIVEVTQDSTGQVFTAVDDASVAAYFPRTITRTVNASSGYECQDAANYLKSRFAQPSTRVAALKLHPSAVPALWPVCLTLEQGMRIRVMRRPFGAPPITIDCFVEKLDWTQTDGGDAVLTLQASRADTTTYGSFAAWHTTLGAASAVGAQTITVNAPQDNINPLAAQIAPGTQIVVGQGGSVPETMTVQSVASSGSPWTTGTITFTTTLAHSHTNGFSVCEALPAGVTDPTTWDAISKFDSHAFAY